MPATTVAQIKVIDTDTHVTEPADLWTSRVPTKWIDAVPHVSDKDGIPCWRVGDEWLTPPGYYAQAGTPYHNPEFAIGFDEIDAGSYDAAERLRRMDAYGVWAQVLYPNIIGFETGTFMRMDRDVSLACVQAYNDFLIEFAGADPNRLIPIAMVPFWDVEASAREIARCAEVGHKGVLFGNKYEVYGLPNFADRHWDPIYAAATDADLSINFHIGFSSLEKGVAAWRLDPEWLRTQNTAETVAGLVMSLINSNGATIANLLTGTLLDRFPSLDFVSVESGFGYLPFLIEALDWHWHTYGLAKGGKPLPSERFFEHCYATFWFEKETLPLLERFSGNLMFETDYPHSTCMCPGPASPAQLPGHHIAEVFGEMPPHVVERVLYGNAAKVYRLN